MRSDLINRQRQQRRRSLLLRLGLWLLVLLGVLALLLVWWQRSRPAPPAGHLITGVASVHDGDTLEIHGTKIRLFGVDAPEAVQTCRKAGREYPCGREAALALSNLLGRQTVTCERRDTDRYGRTVAVCRVGQTDANAWMVAHGWALAYREYSTAYVPQENAARKAKLGIHAGTYVEPWNFRKGVTQPAPTKQAAPRGPYASCALARAAGKTPVLRGEPGYNPKLDGDRDGKMCE